jgi:hypothetical protein
MEKNMTPTDYWLPYDRITGLLEELPPASVVVTLRRQLLRQAGAALAHRDSVQLEKLYRETKALAASLGIGFDGTISRSRPDAEHSSETNSHEAPPESVRRRAAGPGLPGWGRQPSRRRVTYGAPRDVPIPESPRGAEPRAGGYVSYAPPKAARNTGPRAEALDRYFAELRATELSATGHWAACGPDDSPTWSPYPVKD